MIDRVTSKNGVAIRLTDERWAHIMGTYYGRALRTRRLRSEIVDTVSHPERVRLGGDGEMIAVRELEQEKHLVVVYREWTDDGFIITAFLTRRVQSLEKRRQVWP